MLEQSWYYMISILYKERYLVSVLMLGLFNMNNIMQINPQNTAARKQLQNQVASSSTKFSNKILPITRQGTKLTNNMEDSGVKQQTISKVKIHKNFLADSSVSLDQRLCAICHEYKKKNDMVIYAECLHTFCYNCVSTYVMARMHQNKPLNCCEQNCPAVLNSNKLIYQSDLMTFIKKVPEQKKRQIKAYIKRNRELSRRCEKCTYKKENYKLIDKLCEQCKKDVGLLPEGHKKCRSCWKIIEKQKGCDHVKCPCGFQFCFRCDQEWQPNHICEDRFPQRTGVAMVLCFIIKIPIYIVVILIIFLLFTLLALFICLLSASFLGFFQYFKILDKISKTQQINGCCKFLLLVLSIPALPIIVSVCIVPGFMIPLINLCYKETILLHSGSLSELAQNLFGCILMIRLI